MGTANAVDPALPKLRDPGRANPIRWRCLRRQDGGSSAARSTLGTKEFVVPPSRLSAASHNANACQARRRCGSVKAVIPQSHAAYAVGSMAIPFVGWRAYLTNSNRQRHKSQFICRA
jgi:hypothetical protein